MITKEPLRFFFTESLLNLNFQNVGQLGEKDLFLISRSKQPDDNCNRELRCLPFSIYILEQFI